MIDKQPEALRLADILEHKIPSIECLKQAAAELRSLDDERYAWAKRSHMWMNECAKAAKEVTRLAALNAELVEALEEVPYMSNKDDYARLAKLIAKAKGQT